MNADTADLLVSEIAELGRIIAKAEDARAEREERAVAALERIAVGIERIARCNQSFDVFQVEVGTMRVEGGR